MIIGPSIVFGGSVCWCMLLYVVVYAFWCLIWMVGMDGIRRIGNRKMKNAI